MHTPILKIARETGFLRYWTISNLPLFVLAAPMLYILLHSCMWALHGCVAHQDDGKGGIGVSSVLSEPGSSIAVIHQAVAHRIAGPQIVLSLLALSTYHVQIITRLSSGYPVWYWWLASLILGNHRVSLLGRDFNAGKLITNWMIIYAVVQGGLFASFLPPA